jgi:hypothetical protein
MILLLIKKKKGALTALANIILGLVVLLLGILIVYSIKLSSISRASEAMCEASINAHISFVEANLVAFDAAYDVINFGIYFVPIRNDLPEIKCNTKLTKLKASDKDAEKKMLKSAIKNFDLFKRGKVALYSDIKEDKIWTSKRISVCFIQEVFEFDEPVEFYMTAKGSDLLVKEMFQPYNGNENVEQYFNLIGTDDNHIYYQKYIDKYPNLFHYGVLSYPAVELPSDYVTPAMEIIGDVIKQEAENYFYDLNIITNDPADLKSLLNGKHERYAVIFHQYHLSPSAYKKLHSSIILGEKIHSFIISSIIIVPYDEDVMSNLQCEYMPATYI